MAFAAKYRCIHKTPSSVGGMEYTIDILKKDYVGSVTDISGWGESGVFDLYHEKLDPQEPLKNPIQKGRLEFYLAVTGAGDKGILEEIFAADEGEYQLQLKIDGSVHWTGWVLSDLVSYNEGPYPYEAKIIAKDFTVLKGLEYPLTNVNRTTLIDTISDQLEFIGIPLTIKTATSWTEQNITQSEDFLNQIRHDRRALRKFANNGDETDQPITVFDALEKMCYNFGLILRQIDNTYYLQQVTEYEDPTSVQVNTYNATGVLQSSSTIDTTISGESDSPFRKVTIGSVNTGNAGIKRATVNFEHRSEVSGLQLPSSLILDSVSLNESYTQFLVSDGNQRLNIKLGVEAEETDVNKQEAYADLDIQAGYYYYNYDTAAWQSSYTNSLLPVGLPIGDIYNSNVDITTALLPSDADGDIIITLRRVQYNDGSILNVVDETFYRNLEAKILNPSVEEGNNTSVTYELKQAGNYSYVYNHASTFYGDGPTKSAVSALRFSGLDPDTTSDSWRRRGETPYQNIHQLLLREFMDPQRVRIDNLQARLIGNYNPINCLTYDSNNYFWIGGRLNGGIGEYSADFIKIDIQTANDDEFNTIYNVDRGAVGSGGTTTPGGGGGSSTVNWENLIGKPSNDAEWAAETGLVSQLWSLSGTRVQNLIDLEFPSLTITGALSAGTLRPDSGKFLSPVSYQFRNAGDTDFRDVEMGGLTARSGEINGSLDVVDSSLGAGVLGQFGNSNVVNGLQIITNNAGLEWGLNALNSRSLILQTNQVTRLKVSTTQIEHSLTLIPTSDDTYDIGSSTNRVKAGYITRAYMGIIRENDGTNAISLLSGARDLFNAAGTVVASFPSTTFQLKTNTSVAGTLTPTTDDTRLLGSSSLRWNTLHSRRIHADILREADGTNVFSFSGTTRDLYGTDGSIKISFENTVDILTDLTVTGNAQFNQNLRVEGGLFAKEFVVNQTRVMFDHAMSVGGGKIGTIDTATAGAEKVYFEDENGNNFAPVAVNDIIHIQIVRGVTSGVIVKNLWRRVSDVTSNLVTLTTSGINWTTGSDVGSIEVGDSAVVKGNTSNAGRDHYISYNLSSSPAPAVTVYDNVTDVEDDGDIALAWGNLDGKYGISGTEFGIGAGDSSLTGNYFYLTSNSAGLKMDTYDLLAGGLRITSTGPKISITESLNGGDKETVLIDTTDRSESLFPTQFEAEQTLLFDDGIPVSDIDGALTVDYPDATAATSVFKYGKSVKITKLNFYMSSSSATIDMIARVDGRKTGGNWQNISNVICIDGQTIGTSPAEYTCDNDIEFYTDPYFDEFRIRFDLNLSAGGNAVWEFAAIIGQIGINESILSPSASDFTQLRTKKNFQILSPFESSTKVVFDLVDDKGVTSGIPNREIKLVANLYYQDEIVATTDILTYTP